MTTTDLLMRILTCVSYALLATIIAGCLTGLFSKASTPERLYVPPKPVLDVDRIISCLKQTENWDGVSVGQAGERGAMQMKLATWRQFTSESIYWADRRCLTRTQLAEVDRVEKAYVTWLITACYRLGRQPTVYLIALIHTAGYGAVESGRVGAAKWDFSQRVENLYNEEAK